MSIPDYTPTDWVDNVTPVDASRMDNLDQGLDAVNAGYNALEARTDVLEVPLLTGGRLFTEAKLITDWNSATENGWYRASPGTNAPGAFAGTLVIGRVERAEGFITQTAWQYATDNANLPVEYRRRYDGDWGPWLAIAASGSSIDYENAWSSIVNYTPGDVVIHNGVEYLSVNPSLNQTPPTPASPTPGVISLVTALPSTPFDGQEVILTDSLTSPTYTWRFRYVSAKATNKWVYIGGVPIYAEVVTEELSATTPGSYIALATAGPSIAVPVAGDYFFTLGGGLKTGGAGGSTMFMSYDIGGTAAVDADALMATQPSGTTPMIDGSRTRKKSFAAVTLTAKYKGSATNISARNRTMQLEPIAVGG